MVASGESDSLESKSATGALSDRLVRHGELTRDRPVADRMLSVRILSPGGRLTPVPLTASTSGSPGPRARRCSAHSQILAALHDALGRPLDHPSIG